MPKRCLYQCSQCDQTFTRNNTRERHQQEAHHTGQPKKCSYCNATFSRCDYFSQERHYCHEKRSALGENDGHKCEICEKIFTRKDSLQKHISQVHSGKRYSCTMCPASFSQNYKLNKHLEKHQGHPSNSSHKKEGKRTCKEEYQNRVSHSVSGSKNQDKKKESPGSSSTDTGSKEGIEHLKKRQNRSKKRKQLKKEVSNSSGSSFACSICNKQFSKQANVNRHVSDVHEVSKGFPCTKCPTYFARKEKLERHMSEVHKETKELFCKHCPKIFARAEILERHISEVHKKIQLFSCPANCTEKFSRRENLERHLKTGEHTVNKDCKYCNQEISVRPWNAYKKHFVTDDLGNMTCVNMLLNQEYSFTCCVCKTTYKFKSASECYEFEIDHQFTNPEKTNMLACKSILSRFLSYQCAWCKEKYSFKTIWAVLQHFNGHYMVAPCYKKMIMRGDLRMKRGLPALNTDYKTCAGLVKRDELDMKKYPMAFDRRCTHLECARVTTKIVHPKVSRDVSLVSTLTCNNLA